MTLEESIQRRFQDLRECAADDRKPYHHELEVAVMRDILAKLGADAPESRRPAIYSRNDGGFEVYYHIETGGNGDRDHESPGHDCSLMNGHWHPWVRRVRPSEGDWIIREASRVRPHTPGGDTTGSPADGIRIEEATWDVR